MMMPLCAMSDSHASQSMDDTSSSRPLRTNCARWQTAASFTVRSQKDPTVRTIAIVPYDPTWPADFRRVAAPLRAALGDLALRIDHIGSPAVPGLAAKDIIDVQITIADLDPDPVAAALAPLGYTL